MGLTQEIKEMISKVSTGNICDAITRLGMNPNVMAPLSKFSDSGRLVGIAMTILQVPKHSRPISENKTRHVEVFDGTQDVQGKVLVIGAGNRTDTCTFGALLAMRWGLRGGAGIITDSGVRDVEDLRKLDIPIYARCGNPVASKVKLETSGVQIPVECAGAIVTSGDLIVGDDTGIVVVPAEMVQNVIPIAVEIALNEKYLEKCVREGQGLREARKN